MQMTSGISHTEQQRLNRSLVLNLLRRRGCCSRAELAQSAALKRATITNIIGEFIDLGLVVETGLLNGQKGRRSIGLQINGQRYQVIGVMITRKHFSLARIGLSGEVHAFETHQLAAGANADEIIRSVKKSVRTMIRAARDARVLAIGVALPGPYKQEQGEVVFVTNQTGWENVPVRARLQEGFEIPVILENDANAAAYAQYWYGTEGAETDDLAYIVAGEGIGCGLLSQGRLVRGAMGIAGEIGHTSIHFDGPQCECGNRGCLELYCSLLTLERRIHARLQRGDASLLHVGFSAEELGETVQQGDAVASEEYRRSCEYLSIGIINVVNQFNPKTIVIGEQLSAIAPEMMLRVIGDRLSARVRPVILQNLVLEIDKLPYNSIALGAGAVAAHLILNDPFAALAPAK